MSKPVTKLYQVGEFLLFGMRLQLIALLFTLRGAIILGIFPSIATTMKLLARHLSDGASDAFETPWKKLYQEFRQYYRESFRQVNVLSLGLCLLTIGLSLDLWINVHYLRNQALQIGLVIILSALIVFWMYLFAVYNRYALPLRSYIRQTVVVAFSNILQTLAIFISIIVLTALLVLFPVVLSFLIVPLYLLPLTWFTNQACIKLEVKTHYEGTAS